MPRPWVGRRVPCSGGAGKAPGRSAPRSRRLPLLRRLHATPQRGRPQERSFALAPPAANGQAAPRLSFACAPAVANGRQPRRPLGGRCFQRRGAAGRAERVTQREAAAAAGTRRPLGRGSPKMSVAGLKKQFHKASQVRGAAPGEGPERWQSPGGGTALGAWFALRAQRVPRSSASRRWHHSLSPRGALPSALLLGFLFDYCPLASCADLTREGCPFPYFPWSFKSLF